jgi:hypothetical protein
LTLQPDGRPFAERDGLLQYFCGRYCLLEAVNKWMDELHNLPSEDGHRLLHYQARPQLE